MIVWVLHHRLGWLSWGWLLWWWQVMNVRLLAQFSCCRLCQSPLALVGHFFRHTHSERRARIVVWKKLRNTRIHVWASLELWRRAKRPAKNRLCHHNRLFTAPEWRNLQRKSKVERGVISFTPELKLDHNWSSAGAHLFGCHDKKNSINCRVWLIVHEVDHS